MNINLKAFLDMIAFSEGTYNIGDNGYNVLVGSTKTHPLLFMSYAEHPNIFNKVYNSTAAGRYQELYRNYKFYKVKLGLKDFSPPSQDAIATEQLRECHALDYIMVDDFDNALVRCAHLWASLPGANYGQHENKVAELKKYYEAIKGK